MGFRYLGTKTRVFPWILDAVSKSCGPGGHVVDLMSGTGSVAAALRGSGFRVTANDVMTYSYHHARTCLLLSGPPTFSYLPGTSSSGRPTAAKRATSYEEMLTALTQMPGRKGYFWREFSEEGLPRNGSAPRNYFTPENAQRIDSVRAWVRFAGQSKRISSLEHSLLLHDLIMAANDVANIAGTYGHFLSKTIERSRVPLLLTPTQWESPILDCGGHQVLQGYAEDVSTSLVADVCYIDPPYMKRQYAANYHVLETLAREDEPEAAGISGLRPWRDQYSNFCTKTKIRDSFRRIFGSMRCPRFVVSYSEDGLLSVGDLGKVMSEFGHVDVQEFRYKRFRSNDSALAPELTEYLLLLNKSKNN